MKTTSIWVYDPVLDRVATVCEGGDKSTATRLAEDNPNLLFFLVEVS